MQDQQNMQNESVNIMEPHGKIVYVLIFLAALAVAGGIYAFSTKSQTESMVLDSTANSLSTEGGEDSFSTGQSSQDASTTGRSGQASLTLETVDELIKEDIKVGTGAEAVNGKSITVHYTGTLTDGTKFDSSLDRGTPYTLTLGAGEVIEGWDLGLVGMKVGGKRKLTIPASLGYGEMGSPGVIPGGATLVFEVELLKVE